MRIFFYKIYVWFISLFATKKQIKEIQIEALADLLNIKPGRVIKQKLLIANCKKIYRNWHINKKHGKRFI